MIILPKRKPGRQSKAAEERYEEELATFCGAILQIQSSLDFQVSSRGWCYILEEHGLLKGDFDGAQKLFVECRKQGLLPLNFVADDSAREFGGLEAIDDDDIDGVAEAIIDNAKSVYRCYTPFSFWDDKDVFIQALVEKIDLKHLFKPVFNEFHIPFANARGWSDLNSRASLMRRFEEMEDAGKRCVLLYCGDHDPGGLAISDFLRPNLEELTDAVEWFPGNLIIDRFGLNYDFIEENNLTWIDNLVTSSGGRLDDPRHKDHRKFYVQSYLKEFGVRKVEANALVVRSEAGRRLCREAILKYLDEDDPVKYRVALEPCREELHDAVLDKWGGVA
jgi:hypothetical protein